MITRYIKGDITETELKYIAHGVNCQNVMGSGVAKALYTKFPEVKTEYHRFCEDVISPKERLGSVCIARTDQFRIVFNCFTQINYGYDGKKYVSYPAIIDTFRQITKFINFNGSTGNVVAIPKIGCGLAGGDWNIVEQLINDTVGDDLEIWVYELEQTKYSKGNDLG